MTKGLFVLSTILFALLVIFILLFVIFRAKAKRYKEEWQTEKKKSEEYMKELAKAKAAEWIKSDGRKKTDEKNSETSGKSGRDKFDVITDGLRNNKN